MSHTILGGIDMETIIVVFMCLLVIFVMVILPIILTKQNNKELRQNCTKHIRFDTSFCSFLLEDRGEIGYEGEIEWEYNPGKDKKVGLFFETDNPVKPPEGGYAGLAMVQSEYTGVSDLEIEKLVQVIPKFEEIRPGKCYHRLESILSDRKRIDTEIRQAIADYFLPKTDLIKENATRQELMDGIGLSLISVYRNGVTEYDIFDTEGIYVDDLKVVIKEDGIREIHYKSLE